MEEHDWLAWTEPYSLLRFLEGRTSPRKVRLFACACCRLVWAALADIGSWAAVEAAERFADGEILLAELQARAAEAWADGARLLGRPDAWEVAREVAQATMYLSFVQAPDDVRYGPDIGQLYEAEQRKQAAALRDLIGPHPFRPVALDPAVRLRDDAASLRLAGGIYHEGAFADLPVLADALEDGGCTDEEILAHCRSGNEHFRGCWVVDLVLGKE